MRSRPRIRLLIASEGKPLGYVATRDLTSEQGRLLHQSPALCIAKRRWPMMSALGQKQTCAAQRPGQLLIGCERLQESDQLYSALRRCQTTVGLHVVAGHCLIGVCDEAFEVFLVP